MDTTALKKLAEGMKGWDKMTECWPCDESGPDWQVGRLDEDDNRWPLLTVDTEQYDQEQDAPKIAQYYAAANPAAVLEMIAENELIAIRLEESEEVRSALREALMATEAELCELKAENAKLRKDSGRYRYARTRSAMSEVGMDDQPVPESVSKGHDLWIDSRMELEAASAKFS